MSRFGGRHLLLSDKLLEITQVKQILLYLKLLNDTETEQLMRYVIYYESYKLLAKV
jgi:hypothetical protein